MAAPPRATALLLLACCCLFAAQAAGEAVVVVLRRGTLPSSATTWAHRRRALLGNSTTALQPLYGSVRDNGVFTVHVALGTPAQTFDMIVDTGSTLAYVPCRECGASCGTHEVRPHTWHTSRLLLGVRSRCKPPLVSALHSLGVPSPFCLQDPFFSPELSSTFRDVPCSSPMCAASFAQRCQLGALRNTALH